MHYVKQMIKISKCNYINLTELFILERERERSGGQNIVKKKYIHIYNGKPFISISSVCVCVKEKSLTTKIMLFKNMAYSLSPIMCST